MPTPLMQPRTQPKLRLQLRRSRPTAATVPSVQDATLTPTASSSTALFLPTDAAVLPAPGGTGITTARSFASSIYPTPPPSPTPMPHPTTALLSAPTTHRNHRLPRFFPQRTFETPPSNTSSPEARLHPPCPPPQHLPSRIPLPHRPAGPPQRRLPSRRTTIKSPTTPAGHPSRPQTAQTKSTTLSTTMPGSLAPSRTAATLKCALTTSATFSTSKGYAWTSSRTPSANTI